MGTVTIQRGGGAGDGAGVFPLVFPDRSTQEVASTPDGFGWSISTAKLRTSFSVVAEDSAPNGLYFKSDGTRMYVLGRSADKVVQYNLSTPWDVSTAAFTTGQEFSVVNEETNPKGLFFRADGLKMYIAGSSGDEVNEYDLSTPWDVTTAAFLQLFSVATEETSPTGVFFKPDGKRMYIIGSSGDEVNEYDLSTPWDVTTAAFVQLFSVAAQDTNPEGISFRPDGTKMYVLGTGNMEVHEYNLSTPWDVSTAAFVQSFNLDPPANNPRGIFFKPDGTKMYVTDNSDDEVHEYNLGLQVPGNVIIGNSVSVVGPTAPNRTITMVVGGVTLFLHAKTTND